MENATPSLTTKSNESEVAIYALIKNISGLKRADKIVYQEQYEIKSTRQNSPGGKIRVRKETFEGVDTYTQTVKVRGKKIGVVTDDIEYTINIDKEMFEAFKVVASSGMIKTRHIFNLKKIKFTDESEDSKVSAIFKKPAAAYEVDVFSNAEGLTFGWCKIDLELDVINDLVRKRIDEETNIKIVAKVSGLPFKPEQCFIADTATEEQKKILEYLYKEVFTIENF